MRSSVVCWAVWIVGVGCASAPEHHDRASVPAPAPPRAAETASADVPLWVSDPAAAEVAIEREAAAMGGRSVSAEIPVGDLDRGLVACRALWRSGRAGAAADGYRALIRAWPDEALPRAAYARLLITNGDPEGATEVLSPLSSESLDRLSDGRYLRGVAELHGGDVETGVALLREELAEGDRFVEAALELAAWFAGRDLHGEATAVVDAALGRSPDDVGLRVCAARLEFETARFDACRHDVDVLLAKRPDEPRALLLLADVAQAQGDAEGARRAVDALLGPALRDDPWVVARRDLIGERQQALMRVPAGGRPPMGADALLAIMRGGERGMVRLAAYRALMADPRTQRRATQVALHQEEPALRVAAVRAFQAADAAELEHLLRELMADPDPRVRGAVALRAAADLPSSAAIRLLRGLLDAEDDAYAFRCAHAGLQRVLGPLVQMSDADAASPTERARIRNEWRQLCPE